MAVDQRIALLARRQHGPVHHDQLNDLGLSDKQIAYRLNVKRLHRVQPRVYTVGLRDLSDLGSWSAAVLAAGDEAALGIRSAGQFHRIHDGYKGRIELLSPERKRIRLNGAVVKQAALGPHDVITRMTSASPPCGNLRKLLARHRDDNGTGRGGFENAVYPWLRSWLPQRFKIQRNVDFEFDDGTKAQADFLIGNLWIETDYYRHHQGAGPQKATEDIQRERGIRQAGFDFGRYTDWEFDNDRAAIRVDIARCSESRALRRACARRRPPRPRPRGGGLPRSACGS